MFRTTIMLPEKLKKRAANWAQSHGMSLGELIRASLKEKISHGPARRTEDPIFKNLEVYAGEPPPDLSARHDEYLYGGP